MAAEKINEIRARLREALFEALARGDSSAVARIQAELRVLRGRQ